MGGEAAFSSCMCKYQAAALLHLDKSSDGYRGDVMLMRAKTGTLASNPDDVVLSSRSLSQMHVYPLFLKKNFATAVIPNFTVTTDQMAAEHLCWRTDAVAVKLGGSPLNSKEGFNIFPNCIFTPR